MSNVTTPQRTHTTFSLTLSTFPGLPPDDELTHSVLDGISQAYLQGLQDYLKTLGIEAAVEVSMQRCDYVSNDE
jgi:hypothetical protein